MKKSTSAVAIVMLSMSIFVSAPAFAKSWQLYKLECGKVGCSPIGNLKGIAVNVYSTKEACQKQAKKRRAKKGNTAFYRCFYE